MWESLTREREPGTEDVRLPLPDEASGVARPSPEGRIEGEYRQIVSTFNGIVRLHVATLWKILDIVGSSGGIAGSFDTCEFSGTVDEPAGTGRAANGTPSLPKSNVMNLIGDARTLSEAAVEGRLATASGGP
jgi:hypothetical protein